jgi:nucleoside-diphosphate-sugar epimerase
LFSGPGVRANFLALVKAVDRGIPLPLGAVRNRRSLISVTNLGSAVAAVLGYRSNVPEVLAVSDGADVSTPDLIRAIASAFGKPPRLVPVPVTLLRAGASLVGRSASAERLAGSFTLDTSAIRESLRWTPPQALAAGLADVARWYAAGR